MGQKLTTCMICYNEEDMIRVGLRSALTVSDEVVIVDGFSTDKTVKIIKEFIEQYPGKIKLIQSIFNHDSVYNPDYHFGMAKQLACDNATGDWILMLDADECIDTTYSEIHNKIEETKNNAFAIEYIHFINDFGHIDNSQPVHIGLMRLHRNLKNLGYAEKKNHALPKFDCIGQHEVMREIKLYHLGYLRGIGKIRDRFLRNNFGSTAHPIGWMRTWKMWHYTGDYPTKRFDMELIPKIIKEEFFID